MKKRTEPKEGQESVWDYPRPPRLEKVSKHLRVEFGGEVVADTKRGYRVLETSHPPVYYFPPEDVRMELLEKQEGRTSFCEFKGRAVYWGIVTEAGKSPSAAWSYPDPNPKYREIAGYLAFYPSRIDAGYVGDEQVQAQEGDFYGGWITEDVVGPFKGD